MNLIGEKKVPSPFGGAKGNFGLIDGQFIWVSCRENFHAKTVIRNKCREYFYCGNPNVVANFIWYLEQHLGLPEKTHFMFTDKIDTVALKLAQWWVDNPMRHQFFTIALRASLGSAYSWIDRLRGYSYALHTTAAVNRFLDGYTWFVPNKHIGWVQCFGSILGDTHKLKQILVADQLKLQRLAYFKWEQAGKPEGRDFWGEALREANS